MHLGFTEEQNKKYKKILMIFMLKSLWNGVQHGVMAIVMNFILAMACVTFFDGDDAITLIGGVAICLFVFIRLSKIQRINVTNFKKSLEQITK